MLKLISIASLVALLAGCEGCSAVQDPKAAHTALDAANVACVFLSTHTDAKEVLQLCKIHQTLEPVIREMIDQREAARREGVRWTLGAVDGGAPAVL